MQQPKLVQIPATVVGFKPRADRSWRLDFETRELTGDEVALLADNFQGEGWLVYKPNEINLAEIPEEAAESGVKSPGQRLRDIIYVYWKQRGGTGDFEAFYRTQFELLIDFVKSKLEPKE